MEITAILNRNQFFSSALTTLLNLILFLFRKTAKTFSYPDGNVVIIALHKIGDSVCTIPAIREIAKHYDNKIIILCYPENKPIYNYALKNIEVRTLEHKYFYFEDRIAKRAARKKLRSLRPEIIFDITGVMTSASLIFNLRAKKIIGFNREQFKALYDHYSKMRTEPHLIDIYIEAVSSFLSFDKDEVERGFPENIVKNGRIIIHPFAGVKSKEWSLQNFISLAVRLRTEYETVFVIHPGSLAQDVIDEIQNCGIEVIITNSIDELIYELQSCTLLISNDAGPIHVANLMGKATFSIFGPSNPVYSLPTGKNHAFVKSVVSCSPVKEKYCFTYVEQSCPSNECMKSIRLDDVESKIKEFITVLGIMKKINSENSGIISTT